MAQGKTRWDIDVLRSSINSLRHESENLRGQRDEIITQQARVDTNWQSPAGQQYQNRLANDIKVLNNTIEQLDEMLRSLQDTVSRYSSCESKIAAALNRLPNI